MAYIATMPSGQREARRVQAVKLRRAGEKATVIAERLGVAVHTVYAWCKKARIGGVRALKSKPKSGRPRKLGERERRELGRLVIAGPRASGSDRDLWTLPMIRELIQERFGVTYHVDHLGRVMALLNLTRQKPKVRAVERDEKEIKRFVAEVFPDLEKNARGRPHHCLRRRGGLPDAPGGAHELGAARADAGAALPRAGVGPGERGRGVAGVAGPAQERAVVLPSL